MGFVNFRRSNFLPNVARNVVTLDGVNNSLLVNSTSESEDIIVLKDAKRGSSTRDTHIRYELPLIFLGVVHFAVAVDLIAYKCADDVNKVLDGANGMIGVGIVHVTDLVEDSKKIIVSIEIFQINTHVLNVPAC